MDIVIPKDFKGETPEEENLLEKIEKFLFDVKKDKEDRPFFINGVAYKILTGKPPNTTVFHIMNENQLKEWEDPYVYLHPYAQPEGVYSFQSIDLRNKRTRRSLAELLCFQWDHSVAYFSVTSKKDGLRLVMERTNPL